MKNAKNLTVATTSDREIAIRDAVLKTPMAEGAESGYGRLEKLLEILSKEKTS